MLKAYIKTKLGRKLLLLFVGAALLPLLSFALASYTYTKEHLRVSSERQMQQDAKLFYYALLERLIFARDRLAEARVAADGALRPTEYLEDYFLEVTVTPLRHLEALPEGAFPYGEHHKTGLTVARTGAVQLHAIRHEGADRYLLSATLAPDYLWKNTELLPEGYRYCVLQLDNQPLYCDQSMDLDSGAFQALLRSKLLASRENQLAQIAGEDYLVATRELFLKGNFAAENWHLVAAEPLASIYQPIGSFQRLFMLVALLTLLLIAAVALRAIRRLFRPLRTLETATQQLSQGDFSASVPVSGEDELARLGLAFNAMTGNLNQQFNLLRTFSEIDRLMLQSPDSEQIARHIMSNLQLPGQWTFWSVGIPREQPARQLVVYSKCADSELLHADVLDSTALQRELRGERQLSKGEFLQMLDNQSSFFGTQQFDCLRLIPVVISEQLAGVVWAASAGPVDHSQRDVLRDLADRLAVSIALAEKEKALYHQAHHDPLTGLPNRQLLKDRIQQSLRWMEHSNTLGAVIFIDVDNFKNVNDSLGHAIGDRFLVAVGRRLQRALDSSATLARQGGDEFVVLLVDQQALVDIQRAVERLLNTLDQPIALEDFQLHASVSMGIALFPHDGGSAETLLMNADTALYQAKEISKGGYQFYEQSMNESMRERVVLERDLRAAVAQEGLVLHYQPLVSLTDERLGFEALLRWSPGQRPVSPATFIPLLEDMGLISRVGNWVARRAIAQLRHWDDVGFAVGYISVNLAPAQLHGAGLTDLLLAYCEDAGIAPERVCLEITENQLVAAGGNARGELEQLRDRGFRVAIDDFGTGYSSLSYLQELPADILKIDRAFVSRIDRREGDYLLIASMIELAHGLGLKVTAEGAETEDQVEVLRRYRCDTVQGYFFAPALAADASDRFIAGFTPPRQVN